MLSKIRKAHCDDKMSFGDGPSQAPLFILLQVPLWYRCTDGSTLLVFANIRIVSNTVGLLDGKHNMAAIKLTCALSNTSATFACREHSLAHIDQGNNYFLQLSSPQPFQKANGA
jgi:hypothetical protein